MMMRQVDVLEVRPKKRVLSIRNRQEQFAFYSVIAAAGTARGLRSSCSFSPVLCCFHNSPVRAEEGMWTEVCVGYLRWGIMSVRQRTEGTSTGKRSWTYLSPRPPLKF